IDTKNIESMIAALEKSQLDSEREDEEANKILLESEKLRSKIEKEWTAIEEKKEKIYQKAEEKAEKALKKAREEAELIVEEIRNMKTSATLKEHEWIEAKKMLDEARPELISKRAEPAEKSAEQKPLKPGDDIKLLTVNQQGSVL